MGFWGDLIKAVRSSVFKNELKNGGFQVNSAEKLVNSRTIRTNLSSTSAASFNGTSNVTPGVTGVLPVNNGGTGANNKNDARANLGINRWVKDVSLQPVPGTPSDYEATISLEGQPSNTVVLADFYGVSPTAETYRDFTISKNAVRRPQGDYYDYYFKFQSTTSMTVRVWFMTITT